MRVAIVGAGICGLYLGCKLSLELNDVTIFEKNSSVGNKSCSGIVSNKIYDFVPDAKRIITNYLDYILVNSKLKIGFRNNLLVINRNDLDNIVFSMAKDAGAKVLFNSKIIKEPVGFDKVVYCDGVNTSSKLAIRTIVPIEDVSNYAEVWTHKAQGFIWKIPRGKETEYGIIGSRYSIVSIFNNFLNERKITAYNIRSSFIPDNFYIPNNSEFTVCGDAAGINKPWSGGGIIWGLTAADILAKNFPDFSAYRKEVTKRFLPIISITRFATDLFYLFGTNILPNKIKIEEDFIL